ncbi:hypothetical protein BBK36DRAFT_1193045 [Trichoderma citrinoviride]|uniref:Uncharacterized protein n=1 Tax=Trichoderma citrinoviride TaxID=58853 RepID=A0A2T4BIC4_9HYPO|nr:hypothetical protein BBK36DRAFT_1193045 [Trichoderma citrinoviride]PTB69076.1 hypothetical protein BBK36DRAFT_1193045 [Trichoderma citrinoviride]
MRDQDTPIALRRSRRVNAKSASPPAAMPSPPMTPHRRKSRFCCSDPGPSSISSGLTPMVRRTYLAETPKGRRLVNITPSSPTTPRTKRQSDAGGGGGGGGGDLNLHQTIDGRVERRIRRNGLRDMLHRMEQEKRRTEQSAQTQIDRLRAEVRARDREIYELQNATVVMDTERIWGLEQQVRKLKGELAKRSLVKKEEEATQYYSWAEPSIEVARDDEMDMTVDEPRFGGNEAVVRVKTSPSRRARSSFLTPPPTSPTVAASPCYREASPSPSSRHPHMEFREPETEQLEEEIESLQCKVQQLTATLDSYTALCGRIGKTLSNGSVKRKAVSSSEGIEKQVQLLVQTVSDRAAAATQLTSAIGELGFPGNDASEMIASVAAGFRDALLEFVYLTPPGEVTLPLSRPRGAEVLDLLLTRLRALTKKSREDEDAIDEYHEIEQSLRKELDSRASVIAELEKVVERMERNWQDSTYAHAVQQQLSHESLTAQSAIIAELEVVIEEERKNAKDAMDSMKGELQRVLRLSQSFLNSTAGEAGHSRQNTMR